MYNDNIFAGVILYVQANIFCIIKLLDTFYISKISLPASFLFSIYYYVVFNM
jgi:hypothetical protein